MAAAFPSGWRAAAQSLFRAAIDAVDPASLVCQALSRQGSQAVVHAPDHEHRFDLPLLVVGAGKAAARMAAGCEAVLGANNVYGEVIVADGCGWPLESIVVSQAGHPLPDRRGFEASGRLLTLLRGSQRGALCLISGGASSLLVRPRPPVSLEEKILTTQLLLDSGADIHEINPIRKHLSEAKGGGFLRYAAGPIVGLIISDVVGDEISTIGSGPTAADCSTFADAWAVLQRYHLTARVPPSVVTLLERGMAGELAETVKPQNPEAMKGGNLIIGSNRHALAGAARAAQALGWQIQVESYPMQGDTASAARTFGASIKQAAATTREPVCILAGGETTVQVTGSGRGGRNQEFALHLVSEVAGLSIGVLSAGSDGVDGPTDAAGAFVDGTTLDRARAAGLDSIEALKQNDSYTFFSRLGDLFQCGPTGTNVTDLKIALLYPPSRRFNPQSSSFDSKVLPRKVK